jgi:hypothetical protein
VCRFDFRASFATTSARVLELEIRGSHLIIFVCSEIIIATVVVELMLKMNHFVEFDVSDYVNFVSARVLNAILIFVFILHEYALSKSIVKLFDFHLENVHSRRQFDDSQMR